MASIGTLELDGKTPEAIFNDITAAGLSPSEAAVLLGNWILVNFGKTKRVFNYKQAFPATDADCAAAFTRSFVHADWVDGESVVQAEQTAGEDGFNVRFHRIENDLDGLRADVVRAFTCLAEARASLRALLDEIRVEINKINTDVFECCGSTTPTGPGGLVTPGVFEMPKFVGVSSFAEKPVSIWQTDRGFIMLPSVQTVGLTLPDDPRITRPAETFTLVEENPAIREAFGTRPFTKPQFLERFGNLRTPGGKTMTELLDILPPQANFSNLDAMLDEVADREAAALRTTEGALPVISATFGLGSDISKLEDAPVDRLQTVPVNVRAALSRRGVTTVGALAKSSARELLALLKAEGVAASAGDAAAWVATAKTISRVR
jgi:hypothetical protein